LREPGQVIEIAGVVAVYEVYRQSQSDDGVQGRGRHQIAAVQHGRCPERLGFSDCRCERLAVVVAVGNDADLQVNPLEDCIRCPV
jgi:hypothetical protein